MTDLLGQRFGHLVVQSRTHNRGGQWHWLSLCDCGGTTVSATYDLVHGRTASCGCEAHRKFVATNTTHGNRRKKQATPEYRVWCGMKKRCYNTHYEGYYRYGGRGIQVSEQWRTSFETFLADVGPRPGPGYTLDRIDVDGNYASGNVRWATAQQQARNRRSSVAHLLARIAELEAENVRLRQQLGGHEYGRSTVEKN